MGSDYHFSNYWVNRGGAMSDMKCPICGTILDKAFINDKIRGCPKCRNMGNIELWQELIRTRKALDVAVGALKSAKGHNVVNCVARGKETSTDDVHITLCKALEQITATLENQNGNC